MQRPEDLDSHGHHAASVRADDLVLDAGPAGDHQAWLAEMIAFRQYPI